MMKNVIIVAFLFFCSCSPQSRGFFVRSYNLHSQGFLTQKELSFRMKTAPNYYHIIDVRPPEVFEKGHLKGSTNIPYSVFKNKKTRKAFFATLDTSRPYVFYEENGKFLHYLSRYLDSQTDITYFFLEGGFNLWVGPTEGSDAEAILEQNKERKNAYER